MNLSSDMDFAKFDRCRLLVVGDLMIDEYVWGSVDRISPEAPVQVVAVSSQKFTLGGAGNVANNLVSLGAKVSVLGVVGTGKDGKLLMNNLRDLGVDTRGILQEDGRPTTKKTRIIAEHQQVLRIDRETKNEVSQNTLDALLKLAATIIPEVDVILISDYGKGLVTRDLIAQLVKLSDAHGKLSVADPKGRDFSKYAGVTVLTPNLKEASLASGIEIDDDDSMAAAGAALLQQSGAAKLLVTCGKDGMVFFEPDCQPYKISTHAREVYDVSGAGDTVVAVLGLGLAAGMPFKTSIGLANVAAGIVVGKVGTATVTRRELDRAFKLAAEDTAVKQKSLDELSEICQKLHADRKRIVLTNGCFDLLHVGHIKLFSASKQLGDVLVVAIDDDDSVKRLKGPNRPVIGATERVGILSALNSVDYVTVFATHDLEKIIATVRPHVLTKGSNYASEKVQGRKVVETYGGRVELIPIIEDISTSRIIDHIKNK